MKTTLPVFTITVSFICCFWLFDTGLAVLLNTQNNPSLVNIVLNKLSPPQLYTLCIFSFGYFLVALVISDYLKRTLTTSYRFFIEETYDWLWEVDDKGLFTYSNDRVNTILGYQPNELIGKSLFDFLSLEEAQRLKSLYQAHQPFNTLETTYPHKDGRNIVLKRTAAPIFNRRGHFLGYQGIDRDITSSRWTEQMLRRRSYELEERIKELECLYRLSALFEHSNLSIEATLNHLLVIIPQAWQYPDLACVRIQLFEQVFLSEQFQETQWQLNAPLTIKTQEVGRLELFYRQKRSAGPVFLTEEHALINEISVRLSHFIENKQAERALKHSEAQYRYLVEMLPHGVHELDHQYRIILCNPAGAQMLGYQVTELLGRSLIECCCHKPQQLALSFSQPVAVRRCLTQFVHKSGAIIDVQIDWNDKFNSAHKRVGLIVVMTDISEYKQAQRALEKSEEKYRNLVEHLNDWVWEVDEHSRFTYSSCLVQPLFGYTPEELIGTSAFNLLIVDTGWSVAQLFKVSRRYRKPFVDMETQVRHKNGHALFLSTSARPIFDAKGQFRGYRGVSRNITTRKQMEKTLNTTNRALRIRNHCNKAIIHNTSEAQLLTQICDIFINIAHYQFVWIGFINEMQPEIQPIAQQGEFQEYSLTEFQPWIKRAIRSYCPTLTTPNPDEAVIALPLLAHGQSFGIICLVNHPYQLEVPAEIRLLSQLANDLAYGIMALRAAEERQQAEEALRESEQQFALFMHYLPVAAFIKDAQSRFVYINQYMQTHFQAEHWLGEALSALFPPTLAKAIIADDRSAFDKGFQQTVQTFNDIEGNHRIYQTYKFVIQRVHKPPLLGGFVLDITEQKQAEVVLKTYSQLLEQQVAQRTQTLIENNALLNATLEATADGILVVAQSNKILLYNQKFITMWHIPEALLGRQNYPKHLFFVARQLKVPQQFLTRLRQIHQQPQQEHYECLTFKDGRIYECYIRPYRLHQHTLGQVMSFRNITQRQQAEAALQASEKKYRSILAHTSEGYCLLDAQGTILEANDSLCQMLDYQSETLVEHSFFEFVAQQQDKQALRQQFQGSYELTLITQTQAQLPTLVNATTLKNDDGTVLFAYALITNLTQQKSQEQKLAQAKEAAEAANRAKSEFLANMSHELRTPLNGILGFAQVLQSDKSLNAEQQDSIRIIRQSGEHLLTLINDILDLSKVEAGKIILNTKVFKLHTFLKSIIDIIQIRAQQKGIRFSYHIAAELPAVIQTDETRLRQVLINLLGNAIKFTHQGQVILWVKRHHDKIQFQIEDTGIGIAAEQLELIFQPFQQIEHANQPIEGTGLGLAISQKLVKLLGGQLQVSSDFNQGSLFWFELSLPQVTESMVDKQPHYQIIGLKPPHPKILIIDDDAINRSVLVNLLLPLGFKVYEARQGIEGLEKALLYEPELIFLALDMSMHKGLEMVHLLRQQPQLHSVVVFATSANVFEHDQQKSLAAGCDNFIATPIQIEALVDKLSYHLHLEWLYELTDNTFQPLEVADSIHTLPLDIAESLYNYALIGDVMGILAQIETLSHQDASCTRLIEQLRQLIDEFKMDKIIELIEPLINKTLIN